MRRSNFIGFYATEIYLPFARAGAWLRSFSRWARRKPQRGSTLLPRVSWKQLIIKKPIQLVESRKANGNVRLSELGILCQAARAVTGGRCIFEIGTFDGRSTLNLALNAPVNCEVMTLDLPNGHATEFAVAKGEVRYINKPRSGARLAPYQTQLQQGAVSVRQLYGDSATFDFSPFFGKCDLVFVDGSHAYEYAYKDTQTAFQLVSQGGRILWHDYGVWPGVTRALEEVAEETGKKLIHIQGTSLVCWNGVHSEPDFLP